MKIIQNLLRAELRKRGYDITRHVELSDWLKLHKVDAVLDIGANDGRYASEIRDSGWEGLLISFEPQPNAFERLTARMKNDSKWKGMQIGLGSENTNLSLNAYGKDVLSSFLRKKEDDQQHQVIEVPVRRTDSILDDVLGDASRPFVKIDTQGFEVEIIKGFGKRLHDVIGWQLELSINPLYENQPSIEEVIALMRKNGYALWKILPGLRDPKTLQAFELDGIFFKTP